MSRYPMMNRTPGINNPAPEPKPELTGQALVYSLEDQFCDWRAAVRDGYCDYSETVEQDYENQIEEARRGLR